MARNSVVMLCKDIKLDKTYQNCLTYNESQMVELCNSKKLVYGYDYEFIRGEENAILVPYTYANCIKCNYLAFQNPRYSNKWFFAFIDSVDYVNDKTCRINFTIDYFSTWFDYWTAKSCFVIREHVNDDTIGANLVDEGLALGDFVCNKTNDLDAFSSCKPVLGVSELIVGRGATENVPVFYEHGGIFNGICYIAGEGSPTMTSNIVKAYDKEGKADAIQYIFMAPIELLELSVQYNYNIAGYYWDLRYAIIDASSISYAVDFGGNNYIKPSAINGYTPINKKLLTSPYCYLLVDPHNGNSFTFNYEDFSTPFYAFSIDALLTPGCSIKITPANYKGINKNYLYSFAGAKFPMCSWNSDAYTNWLTKNGVDLGFTQLNKSEASGIAGIGAMLVGGVLMATGVGTTFGAGLMISGATGMFTSMQSDYKAQLVPDQVKGNASVGDINYSLGLINPKCYEMSIKREIAESIDAYFTRFGYKVNKLKLPNQVGRTYFNYVEIGKSEIIGYPNSNGCPSEAMEIINNIYRSGTTLWHNHDRIGNYNDNTIV